MATLALTCIAGLAGLPQVGVVELVVLCQSMRQAGAVVRRFPLLTWLCGAHPASTNRSASRWRGWVKGRRMAAAAVRRSASA
jgi:hypothetical protein